MRYTCTTLLLFLIHTLARSQDANWDVYLTQKEKAPASVFLNMDLIHTAPRKDLPFLVVTGVTFAACRADGLPENAELHPLNEISDRTGRVVAALTKTEVAGTFTCRCERLDYLYVHDTVNVRSQLQALYTASYPAYQYHIRIRPDQGWKEYRQFLYPTPALFEAMANEKLLHPLRLAGDKLEKPRPVEHWLFFANSRDRDLFIQYAASEKFKIESQDYLPDAELPYQLHISRTDPVDPAAINLLTLGLRRKAKACKGSYNGWETVVTKDP